MIRYLNTLVGWTLLSAIVWYTVAVATIYLLQGFYSAIGWNEVMPLVQVPISSQSCFFSFLGMATVPFLWRKKPKEWKGTFEILFAYAVVIYLPIAMLGMIVGELPDLRVDTKMSPVVVEICFVIGSVSGIRSFSIGSPVIALSAVVVALIWKWARVTSTSAEEAGEAAL